MQARGPLMIEHRLIEQMLAVVQEELIRVEKTRAIDPLFVDQAVDFIQVYADRTHHGKEEEIMFRDLAGKKMSPGDRSVMDELIAEHILGRTTTRSLVEANTRYRQGNQSALLDILIALRTLIDFYPRHIAKEDKVFFPAVRAYLTEAEDQAMLTEFQDFDRLMIHEKYQAVVTGLQRR